jgi:hypothetical protein
LERDDPAHESGGLKIPILGPPTGESKQISGFDVRKVILTFESQGADAQAEGVIVTDVWLTAEIPGYEEFRTFESRFEAKLGFPFGPASELTEMFGLPLSKELMEAAKEVSKVNGIPVLKVSRIPAQAASAKLLVEETTTYSDFSSASIDASRFDIPAGFKPVTTDVLSLAPQPRALAGRTNAKLSFRLVVDCTAKGASKPMQLKSDNASVCLAQQVVADESDLQSARAGHPNPEVGPELEIVLRDKAAARMRETTERNIGNKWAWF